MIDVIFCAGRNKRFAEVAIREGFKYGTRHDYRPIVRPFMVDINWECYDWSDYLNKIAEWKPIMAMVPDYESPDQKESMIRRAHELKALGVERVMCCPKFVGAVSDIPDFCIVAISVPTRDPKYKGYLPPPAELKGRKLHLLGGSPRAQIALIHYYRKVDAEVVSTDVNMHMEAAQHGTFFTGRNWRNMGAGVLSTDEAFLRSCRAILSAVKEAETRIGKVAMINRNGLTVTPRFRSCRCGCREMIDTQHSKRKFFSNACKQRFYRYTQVPKPKRGKRCAYCGDLHSRRGRYCKDACKQADYRGRVADRRRSLEQSSQLSVTEQLVQEYGRITMLTQGSGKMLPNGLMEVRDIDYKALNRQRWDIHLKLSKMGLRAMLTSNGWIAVADHPVGSEDYSEAADPTEEVS